MNIAYVSPKAGITLLCALIAFFAVFTAQKAHAQVSDEALAVLQAQVDEAQLQVEELASHQGRVLGATTDELQEQIQRLVEETAAKNQPATKNNKETLKQQIKAYNKQIERFTELRDKAQKKLDALKREDTSQKKFGLKDIKKVTWKKVDPIPNAIDDEYSLYTIKLKSGQTVEVKVCGYCMSEDREAAFKKAGYHGDVTELTDLATEKGTKTSLAKKAPGKNKFSCDRTVSSKLKGGKVACYGMWDYGSSFGDDAHMCGDRGAGKTGCTIKAPMCSSGSAKASKYYSNNSIKDSSELPVFAKKLGVTQAVVTDEVAGLWEYTCTGNASEDSGDNEEESPLTQEINRIQDILKELMEKWQ